MNKTKENVIIYNIGALGYGILEILWRGYTHWSMIMTGGICFLLIYKTNLKLIRKCLMIKCLVGSIIVTTVEFIVGSIVNLKLKWNVWSYEDFPLNLFGQICILYSFLWFLLCIPLNLLCKYIRKKL